ncbi:MAG: MBL fold metallo-hydrolase [Myxococcaceae bacterium]|nr:MBL fold metallo-hydrolase [Myxococcaceae bacterium]
MRTLIGLLLVWTGCADVTGIENKKSFGPAIAMIDLFTSCYLVKTEVGPILVDACWRPEELRVRLAENGVKPEDVGTVLFTHGHQDQVAGLSILPNARIAALAEEQDVLTKHVKTDPAIDDVLSDGQTLRFGSTEVRVYAVPGHTAGSAAFFIGGVLLLGDNALITAKGSLGPVPRDRSADPDLNVRSMVALADRLRSEGREVKWLAPAHSGGIEAGAALQAFADANR